MTTLHTYRGVGFVGATLDVAAIGGVGRFGCRLRAGRTAALTLNSVAAQPLLAA